MTENADDVVDVAGRNIAAAAMVASRAVEPIAAALQQRAAERARRLEVETRRNQREIEAQRQLMHAELRPVLSPSWWNQDATVDAAAAAWHLANAWRGHDELASTAAAAIEQQAPEQFGRAQFDTALARPAAEVARADAARRQERDQIALADQLLSEATRYDDLDPDRAAELRDQAQTHQDLADAAGDVAVQRQDAPHGDRVEAITASVEGLDVQGARGRIVAAKGSAHRPAAAAVAPQGAARARKGVGRAQQVVRERTQGL